MVGQEGQPRVLFGNEIADTPQGIRIALSGSDSGEQNGLIASHSDRSFDRTRGATVELQILFGARDEEGASLREAIETSEVHVTPGRASKRLRLRAAIRPAG